MQTKQLQVTAMQSKPRGLVQVKASQPSSEPKRTYIPQMPRSAEKLAAGLLGAAAAVTLALAPPAFAKEPFLKSTGTFNPLFFTITSPAHNTPKTPTRFIYNYFL